MVTVKETMKKIIGMKINGQLILYTTNNLTFEVKILDLRNVWNRTDALISPVSGTGQVWVDLESLNFSK